MKNKQYFVFLYYFYSVTVENICLYKISALINLSQDEQQLKNLKDVLQNSYTKTIPTDKFSIQWSFKCSNMKPESNQLMYTSASAN
jgi:hypothetical protein